MKKSKRARFAAALPWLPAVLSLYYLFRFTPIWRAALLLFSLLIHEGGHFFAFLFLGADVPRITPVSGGFRFFSRSPLSYRGELFVALAGPVANLVPGILLLLFGAGDPYAAEAGWISVGTGLSNLIPISDHDGGRVLFCLLASRLDVGRAGEVASLVSYGSLLLSLSLAFSLLYVSGAGFYFSVFILFSLLSHPLPETTFFEHSGENGRF